MKSILSRKGVRYVIIFLSVFIVLVVGIKLFTLRTHDSSNPRSRPNGYLMSHTVVVNKKTEQVFDFITYHIAEYYLSLAKAHDRFEILNSDGLTEGAVFISDEYQEDEGVRNRYIVQKVVPNRMIFYSSEPSLIYEKKDEEWVQTGSCNAYVYFDLESVPEGTQLTQTLVIEMPNFFTKFLIDLIISGQEGNEWMDHLVEELEGLKTAIELHGEDEIS